MVARVTLNIQPTDLTDLTVTTDLATATLSDFSLVDGYLVKSVDCLDYDSPVTISSTGYKTISTTKEEIDNNDNYVILEALPKYVSTLSDGTNSYPIKAKVVENQNGGAVKTWTGTKAQYDAIATKDANTLYNITDDTDVSLTILEALYPVGSIYITTTNTCPLSSLISGSTWELVSSGRVLQGADSNHAVGTTAEAGLPNITGETRFTQYDDTNSGAFYKIYTGGNAYGGATYPDVIVQFDASRSNSIYGNSNTVQPPAYFVNIYRRTA